MSPWLARKLEPFVDSETTLRYIVDQAYLVGVRAVAYPRMWLLSSVYLYPSGTESISECRIPQVLIIRFQTRDGLFMKASKALESACLSITIAKQGNITVAISIYKHQTTGPCTPWSTQPVYHALLRAVRMVCVANDRSGYGQLLFMPAITYVTTANCLHICVPRGFTCKGFNSLPLITFLLMSWARANLENTYGEINTNIEKLDLQSKRVTKEAWASVTTTKESRQNMICTGKD